MTETAPANSTSPSAQLSNLWLTAVLRRHLNIARADVLEAIGEEHAEAHTHTFTLVGSTWTIIHTPIAEGGEVARFDLQIMQSLRGGYVPEHVRTAEDVVKASLHYAGIKTCGDTVIAVWALDRSFTPKTTYPGKS